MQFKGRNQDMRCPMVLLNNKEYILDIQEMMIWSILNWRILSDDEIKTLYENKSRETGYMTHRSAADVCSGWCGAAWLPRGKASSVRTHCSTCSPACMLCRSRKARSYG